MTYRRNQGFGMLFRRGRPGLATFLVAIWAGFMVATAGAAIYPPVTAIVMPLVCPGEAQTQSRTFSTRPGETIATREFLCTGLDGKPQEIMFKTLAATFAAYALIAFLLLTLIGLWRGRNGAAAAARAPDPVVASTFYPADPLADFITRPKFQPPPASDANAGEGETTRRLAELKRLHEAGLIGDVDYEAKKAEILAGL